MSQSQAPVKIKIRRFQADDAEAVAQLFHDTVRTVNRQDYSEAQVNAWAPDNLNFRDLVTACGDRQTYVATISEQIVGFAELESESRIGCFYCHKDFQGKGIGSKLYEALERQAKTLEFSFLTVDVSITAKPFFQKMGFKAIRPQQVHCRGEVFTNYHMQKSLKP